MIANQTIKEIITAGVQAPSGSNSQPWKFSVKDGVVTVFALFENDHPVLNYRNRGTLLAHGALLENIEIAAREFGYATTIQLFPEGLDNSVSKITFAEILKEKQDLYPAIFQRSINRKAYKKVPLDPQVRDTFIAEAKGGVVKLVEDKKDMDALAKAISISELLMFENEVLHKLLIEEIVWTKEEETKRKSGLFLKTMELNAPQRMVLKMLKSWAVTKVANAAGFSKILASGNANIYKASSALGVLLVPNDDKGFIEAGRLMERLWLKATAMGLRFQIMTGVGFFWQRIVLGGDMGFSQKHVELVKQSYDTIKKICKSSDDAIPAVVFRIGYGDEPSARSSKKDPEIIFI